jgi:hypothetical protein
VLGDLCDLRPAAPCCEREGHGESVPVVHGSIVWRDGRAKTSNCRRSFRRARSGSISAQVRRDSRLTGADGAQSASHRTDGKHEP